MPPLTGLGLRFGEWGHHQALAGPGHCPGQGCFWLSKAPEDRRSPKAGAWIWRTDKREASWSAAVFCRFLQATSGRVGERPRPGCGSTRLASNAGSGLQGESQDTFEGSPFPADAASARTRGVRMRPNHR
jgi:hypothetical protein